MFEPASFQPPPAPPAAPAPAPPAPEGRALRLLAEVRRAQSVDLWVRGVLWGVLAGLAGGVAGGFGASVKPAWGQALMLASGPVALGVLLFFGLVLARRRVGTDERTARLLGLRVPGLDLDLLAAVELSRALGQRHDFSPDLARAFLNTLDTRLARHTARQLIDRTPTRWAAWALLVGVALGSGLLAWKGPRFRTGLTLAFTSPELAELALPREPITGDFEVTYTYPAYTGLEPRTLVGAGGDLQGPAGTEVLLKTRADRDVDTAALDLSGTRVPLARKGRELSGRFVLETSGQYHVQFLDGARVVARGPDMPVQVVPDETPQVRLVSPLDALELPPEAPRATLKYEATDDYGLTGLELVYRVGGSENRLKLNPDEGRTTRGQLQWDLSPLGLRPGQVVTYYLEAKDNDAVKGPKAGVSRTQTLKLYSAAEHQREALKKAEALWERLVTHLADRMEGEDRRPPASADVAALGEPTDDKAVALSQDFVQLARDLDAEREPPMEILSATRNVGEDLRRDTQSTSTQRRLLLRLWKTGRLSTAQVVSDLGRRLVVAVQQDVENSEKNVLYLESLLDRQKLLALRELARELKSQRRELSSMLEKYQQTKDPELQQALLEQMGELRQRMAELQARMAELMRGIRDEFVNREALQEMMEEQNLSSALDEIEKLVREGKADEALKKMQELSMKMDELFDSLEQASDEAETQADPELVEQFERFSKDLDDTTREQEGLAERTRALKDKVRAQAKERIAQKGAQVKKEVSQKLEELKRSYQSLDTDRFGLRLEEPRAQALQELTHAQEALEANDFDLALDAAQRLRQKASDLSESAAEQRRLDEMFQNPPDVRRESRALHDRLGKDEKKAAEVEQTLQSLFPDASQQLSEAEKGQLDELGRRQGQLKGKADGLQQQMEDLAARAPIFDETSKQQLEEAGQRMGQASQRLKGRDPGKGHGEQQGALQALRGLQQQMQRASSGRGKGLPLPLRQRGMGRGSRAEKVEIPDEDPNQAPREFRKDVMDAMKQGAPDRYRDQNKRYYEELVK